MSDSPIPFGVTPVQMDEESALAVLQNLLSTFVEPEIKRRYEAGQISSLPMMLNAAQVILPGDGVSQLVVRLNEETNIQVSMVLKAGVLPEVDRGISLEDIDRVERMFSGNPEDADSGHIAIKWLGERVIFDFDFRYNRKKAGELVAIAVEFLQAARYAETEMRSWSVFVETLFSGLELATKAFLWTTPWGKAFRAKMPHVKIREAFATFPTTLNNLQGQADALTELARERDSARYLHREIRPQWDEGREWLTHAEQMLQRARAQVELLPVQPTNQPTE